MEYLPVSTEKYASALVMPTRSRRYGVEAGSAREPRHRRQVPGEFLSGRACTESAPAVE